MAFVVTACTYLDCARAAQLCRSARRVSIQRYGFAVPKICKDASNQHRLTHGGCDSILHFDPTLTGCIRMRVKTIRILALISALAAFPGCQTGPRWAWWKHDTPPDSSVVARSAQPVLPSSQSTPQAVAVAGLTPAVPPSSANLAAAGATKSPPNIAFPMTSSATVANAPLANYPAGNSLADKLTSAPNATAKAANIALPSTAAPMTPAAAMPSQPLAAIPAAGPYDPKAYKPASSLASAGVEAAGSASAPSDRYGLSSADHLSTSPPTGAMAPVTSAAGDRYGNAFATTTPARVSNQPLAEQTAATTHDRYGNPAVPPVAGQSTPVPLSPASSATAAIAPPAALPVAKPIADSTAGIQLTSSHGQYRPGGTSNYTNSASARPIEVATRPSPTTIMQPALGQGSMPSTASEPWTPPTPPAAAPSTRTY